MTVPNDDSTPRNEESGTGTYADTTTLWRAKLPSALHAIAFSTAIAVITGVSACIGQALVFGTRGALGLNALTPAPIDQRDIFIGLSVIAHVLVYVLIIVILARLAYLAISWTVKKTGLQNRMRVPSFIKHHLWLLALLVVTTDALVLTSTMMGLCEHVEGILFKSFSDIGDVWSRVIFEEHFETATSYSFLYSGLLALFIWLCWWLVTKGVGKPFRRAVVSILGFIVVFVSLLMFAYLSGAVATVTEYPLVSFTNQTELFGDHSAPILLGEDDKMFAFLIVLTGAKPNDVLHKMVVYIPRSEVKYMAILRYVPLYKMDKYDDMLRLEEQMKSKTQ